VYWALARGRGQLRRSAGSAVGREWGVLLRKRRRRRAPLSHWLSGSGGVPARKWVRRARFSVSQGLYSDQYTAQPPGNRRRRRLLLCRQRRLGSRRFVLFRDMPAGGNLWRLVKRERQSRFHPCGTIRRDPKLRLVLYLMGHHDAGQCRQQRGHRSLSMRRFRRLLPWRAQGPSALKLDVLLLPFPGWNHPLGRRG